VPLGTRREDSSFGTRRQSAIRELDSYIERLEWVSRQVSDPWFAGLDGSERFTAVAVALMEGIEGGLQFLSRGSNCSADDLFYWSLEADELEFLIYKERGTAVEFTPSTQPNSPGHPRPGTSPPGTGTSS
jgi:hypothetical protein